MTNKKLISADLTDSKHDQERLPSDTLETKNETSEEKISGLDKKLLKDSFDPSYDIDLPVDSISLDDKDDEGELLNEGSMSKDLFGEDLDEELIKEEDDEDGD